MKEELEDRMYQSGKRMQAEELARNRWKCGDTLIVWDNINMEYQEAHITGVSDNKISLEMQLFGNRWMRSVHRFDFRAQPTTTDYKQALYSIWKKEVKAEVARRGLGST